MDTPKQHGKDEQIHEQIDSIARDVKEMSERMNMAPDGLQPGAPQYKTVGDYAPADRPNLIGRWCELWSERGPRIITGIEGNRVHYVDPSHPHRWGMAGAGATKVRHDLPRAWNHDGTPPATARVEYGDGWEDDTQTPEHYPIPTADCYACENMDHTPPHRRYVTDWERNQ